MSKEEIDRANTLHKESIIIDTSIVPFINYVGEDIWLDDVLKGGVTASNATVCMQRTMSQALQELSEFHSWAEKKADKAILVSKASDIERAKKEGKHGVIFGPQNSSFLEGNIRFLNTAWDWGVRIIQLCYSERNESADGCSERTNAGLSNFGVELVENMNDKGVLIDLSHVGDKSTMEAIEISSDPVTFTHVCPRAITPMEISPYVSWAGGERFLEFARRRGRTDDALQACAEKGGVVGVTPYFAKRSGSTTLTDDLMDQIDYVVDLVGVKYVGFGSDLDFRNSVTRGAYIWKHPDRVDVSYHTPMDKTWGYGWLEHMPNLTRGLVARGYSDKEIKGILGENFLNLFENVWGE